MPLFSGPVLYLAVVAVLILEVSPQSYENPMKAACLLGEKTIRLKARGAASKICAPLCDPQTLTCPPAPEGHHAKPRCLAVSKRHLCLLTCSADSDCPESSGWRTVCHKTSALSLCLYQSKSPVAGVPTTVASTVSTSKKNKWKSTFLFHNPRSSRSVDLPRPQTRCIDACTSAFWHNDGICSDGGEGSTGPKYCRLGSDCSDCGPRTVTQELAGAPAVIQSGGTLNDIGALWGINHGQLEFWNRIGDPAKMIPGQSVIVSEQAWREARAADTDFDEKAWKRVQAATRMQALDTLLGEHHVRLLKNMEIGVGSVPAGQAEKGRATRDSSDHKKRQCVRPELEDLDSGTQEIPRGGSGALTLESVAQIFYPSDVVRSASKAVSWWWEPDDCEPTSTVAVIVPFRNRESFLPRFLARYHSLLRRQKLRYRIFVVEQAGATTQPFNRAKLLNIGAVEAVRTVPGDLLSDPTKDPLSRVCFAFNDIDLIARSDATPYWCPTTRDPHHLSVVVDTHGKKCVYSEIFGGATVMTVEQLAAVNGYSNMYWGWGGEDDDLSSRIRLAAGRKILRPTSCLAAGGVCRLQTNCMEHSGLIPGFAEKVPANAGHYSMVGGTKDSVSGGKTMDSNNLAQLIVADQRLHEDGINTLAYHVESVTHTNLYTRIRVLI